LLYRKVHDLFSGIVGGGKFALFNGFANDADQEFNRIRCVDRFEDIGRVIKQNVEVVPMSPPASAYLQIVFIPAFFKLLKRKQGFTFGDGLV